jgi:hypothetical protein
LQDPIAGIDYFITLPIGNGDIIENLGITFPLAKAPSSERITLSKRFRSFQQAKVSMNNEPARK